MIKFKLYYYVQSGGDGSYLPKFFTSEEKRDKYESDEAEFGSPETCESTGFIELVVDENGNVSENMPEWLLKPGNDGKTFLEKFPNHEWRKLDQVFNPPEY